jgi:hypothetical protein
MKQETISLKPNSTSTSAWIGQFKGVLYAYDLSTITNKNENKPVEGK